MSRGGGRGRAHGGLEAHAAPWRLPHRPAWARVAIDR